jgi:hypothetical protein
LVLKKYRFQVLPLLTLMLSCSEVVDLGIGRQDQQLVVFGRVTDGLAGNEVNISYTSAVNGVQEPVSGASVILLEDGIYFAEYSERSPGIYRLNSQDSANAGKSYELQIELSNGRSYHSLPAVLPPLAAVDHPRYDASVVEVEVNEAGLEVERNLIQLFVDTEVITPASEYYLRWSVLEAYSFVERVRPLPVPPPPCYISNDITGQKSTLFNGKELKVSIIPDQLLASTEIDSRFAFDYYFSVVQFTMDKSAFEYSSLIDEISNTQGSIFDKPAAPVIGNIRSNNDDEEVLGYFEVVRADTTRLRIRADDIPFRVELPCPAIPDFDTNEPSECTGCLLIKNSSHSRPYFWF